MPPPSPPFDAPRLVHFVTLFDAPDEGEAQAALVQARRLLKKHRLRLLDAVETDAYLEAVTKQAKPDLQRSASQMSDAQDEISRLQAQIEELEDINAETARQCGMVQEEFERYQQQVRAGEASLQSQLAEQQRINARLLYKMNGSHRQPRKWVKVLVVLALLVGLGVMYSKWPLFPSRPKPGMTWQERRKFKEIQERTRHERANEDQKGPSRRANQR